MTSNRKLKLTCLGLLLISGAFLASGVLPPLAELFATFCGAVIALVSAYSGANVLAKKVVGPPREPPP